MGCRSSPPHTCSVEAAGQVYNQTSEFVYLGRNVNQNVDLSIEVDRRIRSACMVQLPEVNLRTVRSTEECSPRAQNPDAKSRSTRDNSVRLRHVEPARVPLRHAAPSPPQILDTLIKTGSESIEATLRRRRRILFAGFVERMENTRKDCRRA